jgi:hypothetical protein
MRELLAAVKIWLQAGACVYATAMLIAISSPAFAEEGNLKDGAKRAGRAVGSVAHDIGHGAKKSARKLAREPNRPEWLSVKPPRKVVRNSGAP